MLPNLKETFVGRFLCLYSCYDKIKVSGTKLASKYNVTKLGFVDTLQLFVLHFYPMKKALYPDFSSRFSFESGAFAYKLPTI